MVDSNSDMDRLWSDLKTKEIELETALRKHSYTGYYVKQVIGERLYQAINEKKKRGLEKAVIIQLKQNLQVIAQIKRNLYNNLGLNTGDVSIDPTLGIVDEKVVDELFESMFRYDVKNHFLFGSKEDLQANINALKKNMSDEIHSMHPITVSIKDIMQKKQGNFVIDFWLTVRNKLLRMVRDNSKDRIENIRDISLFELLRKGYGVQKNSTSNYVTENLPIQTCIIIQDLEELFKLPEDKRILFFRMYEVLFGSDILQEGSQEWKKYLIEGYNTKIFPKKITRLDDEIAHTYFLYSGSKESLVALKKLAETNPLPFLEDRTQYYLSPNNL